MKKIGDLLRPNILIILGAIMFLVYLNFLSFGEASGGLLAIGIIGIIFAVYYLAIGILGIIVGDKFSAMLSKIFDIISACLFPVFMFIVMLINIILVGGNGLLPTGWIVLIFGMIGSLALAAMFPIAKFVNKPVVAKFANLFAAIFGLILLLHLLYSQQSLVIDGTPITLGGIDLLMLVIYISFMVFLFGALNKAEEPKEEKKEEPKEEVEEQPQEQPQEAEEAAQ